MGKSLTSLVLWNIPCMYFSLMCMDFFFLSLNLRSICLLFYFALFISSWLYAVYILCFHFEKPESQASVLGSSVSILKQFLSGKSMERYTYTWCCTQWHKYARLIIIYIDLIKHTDLETRKEEFWQERCLDQLHPINYS